MIINQYTQFRRYIAQNRATNFQILGHPLEHLDDNSKNIYLKMICFILRYKENITEEQVVLMERLIRGAKAPYTMQDYLNHSYYIDVEMYQSFLTDILTEGLRYNFAGDILVLTHIGEYDEDEIQFVAEVIESLGIVEYELSHLLKIVKTILEQDVGEYFELGCKAVNQIPLNLLNYFIKSDDQIYFKVTDDRVSFVSTDLQLVNFAEYFAVTNNAINFVGKKTLRFVNCSIDLTFLRLEFYNIEEIKFEIADTGAFVLFFLHRRCITIDEYPPQSC